MYQRAKHSRVRPLAAGVIALCIALLTIGCCAGLAAIGAVANVTTSMPLGLYRTVPLTNAQLQRGDIVLACMPYWTVAYRAHADLPVPGPGKCPGNVIPVLKHIAALPGDRIRITRSGVTINGVYWRHSIVQRRDSRGGILPNTIIGSTLVLPPGHYWLMTHDVNGFDSRYWGSTTQILARAYPLLTTGGDE